MTNTQDDCRRAFEDDRAAYHRDWSDNSMPITTEEDAAYKAGWDDCYARYRPSAAGYELERIAKKWAWGLAEASNAALAANARADGETFVAAINAIQNETIAAMQPAQPNVDALVRMIRLRIESNEDENEGIHGLKGAFESGRCEGLDDAIAIIRKWAAGGK